MSHPLFSPEVKHMLQEQNALGLKAFCESLHPATVAEALEGEFTPEQIWEILSHADLRKQAAIFEYLPPHLQVEMARKVRPQLAELIARMSHDDRVDLLQRLTPEVREALLRLIDEAERRDIASLFPYADNTVGALMTTDYAWVPAHVTAAEAIDLLRAQAPDKETIYYIYVLDEPVRRADGSLSPRRLLGVLSLRDLILAPRQELVRDLMETEVVTLRHDTDVESAAETFARYDFLAMPVVDDKFGMLGIVTHDDILDVVTREATEDLQKQAGVVPIEEGYLEARFTHVWKNRAKWLAVLFILQMFTIEAMAHFETLLETVAFVMVFVPLCLSVGGNAGSQAATLVIRALALRQVRTRDWLRVLRREIVMAAALAAFLGLLAIARTYFATPNAILEKVPAENFWHLVGVVTGAVMGICMTGALVGAMLPVLIKSVGMDPALMSAPLIATLSDVLGIVIFFQFVRLFFF
ncbi:MAG: magnesium transporter [Thermogemmata sp.]|uniref:Magnesium transporter MgtE n=1 Tax=Thermogemmata fonticola TaxID=2755323 RepID=A0A7V8VB03_9BACT|nr:magnesium transporter [Thermogemmata fonticola]MBA2224717.1 magnesium transporter [Thermogemmata fonticola]MCX8140588.1 magnesium transporter [Gemmataceae bacterium]